MTAMLCILFDAPKVLGETGVGEQITGHAGKFGTCMYTSVFRNRLRCV